MRMTWRRAQSPIAASISQSAMCLMFGLANSPSSSLKHLSQFHSHCSPAFWGTKFTFPNFVPRPRIFTYHICPIAECAKVKEQKTGHGAASFTAAIQISRWQNMWLVGTWLFYFWPFIYAYLHMQNLPPSQWYINFWHFTNVPAAASPVAHLLPQG
jgi:hypothetical protein